jgi:hypothetical protein
MKLYMSEGNSKENSPDSGSNNSSGSKWRTGYIRGNTFSIPKEVKYNISNGMAIFEGDIILARTPEEIEKLSAKPTIHRLEQAVVITGDDFRWPRGEIPYTIQSTLPMQNRVIDAIRHFEDRTPIRFVKRTDSNAAYFPNYVSFIQYVPQRNEKPEEVFHCSSPIGMRSIGEQSIILSDQCITGDAIHEIGHTVGLWHEQSREDRDDFVGIIWDNIVSGPTQNDDMRHNFDQHINDGDDVGPYDYRSIMHYGAWYFSIDKDTRDKPTIEVLRPDLPGGNADSLGQKNGLSDGDIAAVIQMYANVIPGVGRNADGRLEVFVVGSDKQLYHRWQTAPNSSQWSEAWTSLGGQWWVGSNPAVAQNADGRLEVFLVGLDKQLHHRWQTAKNDSSKWSEGSPSLLNEWPDDSAVAKNADGRLEVYIVGSDEHLYHRWQTAPNSSVWSVWTEGNFTTNWNSLGGQFSLRGRPAVAKNADGRLEVFMVWLDRRLYTTSQNVANDSTRNAWTSWNVLGGEQWPDDPVVAQNADGRLEVFLVGLDRRLYHRWQTAPNSSTWSEAWTSLGGQWSHRRRPAVAQNADGRLEVFVVGSDKQLHHRWQTTPNSSSQWSEIWTVLGGEHWPPSSDPGIGRNADGRLEIFLVGSDKQLYHRRQTAPNSSTWSEAWISLGGQFL